MSCDLVPAGREQLKVCTTNSHVSLVGLDLVHLTQAAHAHVVMWLALALTCAVATRVMQANISG